MLRRWPLPVPDGGDKKARGRVLVIGGSAQMPGAIILAATAALRAGAGRLQIATCASIAALVATEIPESLVVGLEEADGALAASAAEIARKQAEENDAVVLGPGMQHGDACDAFVRDFLPDLAVPVVIDAAALSCLHGVRVPNGILTPHHGEMATLLKTPIEEIQKHPQQAVRAACERFGAVVALKGEQTYITSPDGEVYCNRYGTVGLATSGSGDTLAGIIGGLAARGLAPLPATLWGVYLHAKAGEALMKEMGLGFLARELLAQIPPLMKIYS